MSESGFSGLPPGPRTGDRAYPQSMFELKAKIIELRGELKAAKVRQRMEGEIVRHNRDGTTSIKTDKGEIRVELRGRDRLPPGTKVEIDLPPGNPAGSLPKQAIVRPAPEQAPADKAAEKPATPPSTQQQTAPAAETRPAPAQNPRLDIRTAEDLTRHLDSLPPEQRAQIPLREGDLIRLLPLSVEQAKEIVQPQATLLRTLLTPLPELPQINAPKEAFAQISKALTLPRSEHALLSENLPRPLPVLTQATAAPLPLERLETLPLAARTPVQQLLQYVLHANQPDAAKPFTINAPPLTILPQTASFFTDNENSLSLPTPKGITQPLGTMGQGTLFTAPDPAGNFSLQTAIPKNSFFDVSIQNIGTASIRLTSVDKTGTTPVINATINAALPQGPAGSMIGEVTGMTAQQLPVLSFYGFGQETPQNFVMQFPATNLPPGTQVQIMPQAGKAPTIQGGTLPAALAPFVPFEFFSGFGWPALEELTQTLQQAAPQAAQVLASTTPNPAAPARMPMAALFFLAAVRSGDISGWLGDKTVETLRRVGKGDLINRLERDAAGLQRTSTQPSGEWRATALPMMWDGQAHKIMLYYRHDEREDTDKEQDKRRGTRFIFDINLNRLGDLQLDGLHRAQEGTKARLDLIVRTNGPLSAPMQKHMRGLYIKAMEQTNMVGELSFQNKPEQFIKPEMPKR